MVVHVINELENEATTIHWHGLYQRGTPYMDGWSLLWLCSYLIFFFFFFFYFCRHVQGLAVCHSASKQLHLRICRRTCRHTRVCWPDQFSSSLLLLLLLKFLFYFFFLSTTNSYHGHHGLQRSDGLFGALIVHERKQPNLHTQLCKQENVMVLNDWDHFTTVDMYWRRLFPGCLFKLRFQ